MAKDLQKKILEMKSCSNVDGYEKKDYLDELFNFQKELTEIVFGTEGKGKTLIDVLKKYEQENRELGYVANFEFQKVKEKLQRASNQIKTEYSGSEGERKTFKTLETLQCDAEVIKNVHVKYQEHETELDGIVITKNAIFLLEVKNSYSPVYISKKGVYYKTTGNKREHQGNIGIKMNEKVFLLRHMLEEFGIKAPKIISLLVFVNDAANVSNQFPYIRTCFLSELPKIIETFSAAPFYDLTEMKRIKNLIETLPGEKQLFKMPFNMEKFKKRFIELDRKLTLARKPKIIRDITKYVEKLEKMLPFAATFM